MIRQTKQDKSGPAGRRALFFDRDGTLIEETHHLSRLEDVRILPHALEAVRTVRQAGWLPVVVTNQSAVARGLLTEEDLDSIHRAIGEEFRRGRAGIEAFYVCPHHLDAGLGPYRRDCSCRKPKPGLILRAADELGIDLARSYLVGDSKTDVEAAHRAGCRAVLVKTAYASGAVGRVETPDSDGPHPDHVAEDVLEAVRWILQNLGDWVEI